MEIETNKWCQTTWLVKPLRKICILIYFGHDLTLTWPWSDLTRGQILKLTFYGNKTHVSNRSNEPTTMVSFLFSCLWYLKRYQWKTVSVKNDNYPFVDLWKQNCWPWVKSDKNATEACAELSDASWILPSYHTFIVNGHCLRKIAIFSKLHLWWPLVTWILIDL